MHLIKNNCWIALLCLLVNFPITNAAAQQKALKGIVMQLDNSKLIEYAHIKNLSTMAEVVTDGEGKFSLATNLYDKLAIEANGYYADTIYVHDLGVNRIYLQPSNNSIILDEVMVGRLSDSRLQAEIIRAETQGKYFTGSNYKPSIYVSPSRLFGNEGKLARKNIDVLRKEKDIRAIDARFNNELIRSITPLSTEEILLFRQKYRPSLSFIQTATDSQLQLYINDKYKLFKQHK